MPTAGNRLFSDKYGQNFILKIQYRNEIIYKTLNYRDYNEMSFFMTGWQINVMATVLNQLILKELPYYQ